MRQFIRNTILLLNNEQGKISTKILVGTILLWENFDNSLISRTHEENTSRCPAIGQQGQPFYFLFKNMSTRRSLIVQKNSLNSFLHDTRVCQFQYKFFPNLHCKLITTHEISCQKFSSLEMMNMNLITCNTHIKFFHLYRL